MRTSNLDDYNRLYYDCQVILQKSCNFPWLRCEDFLSSTIIIQNPLRIIIYRIEHTILLLIEPFSIVVHPVAQAHQQSAISIVQTGVVNASEAQRVAITHPLNHVAESVIKLCVEVTNNIPLYETCGTPAVGCE